MNIPALETPLKNRRTIHQTAWVKKPIERVVNTLPINDNRNAIIFSFGVNFCGRDIVRGGVQHVHIGIHFAVPLLHQDHVGARGSVRARYRRLHLCLWPVRHGDIDVRRGEKDSVRFDARRGRLLHRVNSSIPRGVGFSVAGYKEVLLR